MASRNSRRRVRLHTTTTTTTTCYETATASICNLNHVAKIFRTFGTFKISNGTIGLKMQYP